MRKAPTSHRKTGGTSKISGKQLYKVLHVGQGHMGWGGKTLPKGAVYGLYSDYIYKSLPRGPQPSRWYTTKLPLVHCSQGFHLTTTPIGWAEGIDRSRFFEAEFVGETLPLKANFPHRTKLCCRSIRLLREVWPDMTKESGFTRVKPKVSK